MEPTLELLLKRFLLKPDGTIPGVTISTLSIAGAFECFMLEDTYRGQLANPADKVPGKTCIPCGRYQVVLDYSPKFGRIVPHILGVPCFEGIRMHPGNTTEDTEGCPLTGTSTDGSTVSESKAAYDRLFEKLSAATTPIYITVMVA